MNLKSFIYRILYYSGLNYVVSLFLRKKIYVVMYHSISSSSTASLSNNLYQHISIDVKDFVAQLHYLKKRGHTFISFDDLDKVDLSTIKRPTIIYFDDGFKDVLIHAVPVLRKLNIPSTIFLVTGILDHTHMLWTIVYRDALTKEGIDSHEQTSRIHAIKTGSEVKRREIMKAYPLKSDAGLYNHFLSWDDVREMSQYGFSFGSHSVSHSRLTESSRDEFIYEVSESKKRIETETNKSVRAFSFPHGRGDETLLHELSTCGYVVAVAKGKGLNNPMQTVTPISYLKTIAPKPGEPLWFFKLRLYILNLKS